MKVLLHADAVGGVFTYALELARALARRGVRVVLATEGAALDEDQRAALAGIPGLAHREARYRLEWMDDPWDDVARAGAWLLAVERRERPDVVHLGSYAHGALPFRAPRIVVSHSCVLSWYEAVRGTPAPASWDRYRQEVAAGLRAVDAIVAPTQAMARALTRHHGPIPEPTVILNGRDPARFRPGEKVPLVLGAGRLWDDAKNVAALLRAAPEVPWAVALAGPVPDPPPPQAIVHDASRAGPLAGSGPARLLGRLPEPALAGWMARASVFAHPARYEPFGLAVLEAALAGCALVLGDIESLRELWDGAALFVPPGDHGALVGALKALAGDRRGREVFAAAARARALRLGPDRMAAGYLALYGALGARPAGLRTPPPHLDPPPPLDPRRPPSPGELTT
jgi:glycosyltransferase involved in cell wall biosynthesis